MSISTVAWALQVLVAFAMLGSGIMKLATPREKLLANPQMGWANDFSASQIKLIGLAEALGAVGLVVPHATGILPFLTPLAGVCLAIIMGGAAWTHIKRKEPAIPAIVLGVLALAVAVLRR